MVLKGFQHCLVYCSLRELIPQNDGTGRSESLGLESYYLVESGMTLLVCQLGGAKWCTSC